MLLGALVGGIAGYAGGVAGRCADARRPTSSWCCRRCTSRWRCGRCCRWCCAPRDGVCCSPAIFAVVGAPFVARGVRAHRPHRTAARLRGRRRRRSAPATRGCSRGTCCRRRAGSSASRSRCSCRRSSSPKRRCRTSASGFPIRSPSWGTMLHDASNVRAFADFPWLLSPAAAMFLVVLGLNLVLQRQPTVLKASKRPASYNRSLMNLAASSPRSPRRSTTEASVDTRRLARRCARWLAHAARRLRRARIERRSGAARRGRIGSRDRRGARRGAAPTARSSSAPAASRRARRSRDEARRGARRRRGAGAHARLLQDADDDRRVRAPLHGGGRRVAGAGAALQLHGGDRRELLPGGGRSAWRRTRTSSA